MLCQKRGRDTKFQNYWRVMYLSKWGRVMLPLTDSVHDSYRLCGLVTGCALEGFPCVCTSF